MNNRKAAYYKYCALGALFIAVGCIPLLITLFNGEPLTRTLPLSLMFGLPGLTIVLFLLRMERENTFYKNLASKLRSTPTLSSTRVPSLDVSAAFWRARFGAHASAPSLLQGIVTSLFGLGIILSVSGEKKAILILVSTFFGIPFSLLGGGILFCALLAYTEMLRRPTELELNSQIVDPEEELIGRIKLPSAPKDVSAKIICAKTIDQPKTRRSHMSPQSTIISSTELPLDSSAGDEIRFCTMLPNSSPISGETQTGRIFWKIEITAKKSFFFVTHSFPFVVGKTRIGTDRDAFVPDVKTEIEALWEI